MLFSFSKIVKVYLQNIPRDAFLFHLRIGIVYEEKNFLITGISNSWTEQNLANTEDTVECFNQTVTVFSLQLMQHSFALS